LETRRVFVIEADTRNLAALRAFVEQAATALGVGPAPAFEVTLAADEAATNIIVHGYQGRPGIIEVEVELQEKALIVRLRDETPAFDPTKVPPPDLTLPLERRPAVKFGVHLMRHSVDKIIHRATPPVGNELILVKYLEAGSLARKNR